MIVDFIHDMDQTKVVSCFIQKRKQSIVYTSLLWIVLSASVYDEDREGVGCKRSVKWPNWILKNLRKPETIYRDEGLEFDEVHAHEDCYCPCLK